MSGKWVALFLENEDLFTGNLFSNFPDTTELIKKPSWLLKLVIHYIFSLFYHCHTFGHVKERI